MNNIPPLLRALVTIEDKLIAFGRAEKSPPSGKINTLANSLECHPADARRVCKSLQNAGYLYYCPAGYPVMTDAGVRALARVERRPVVSI